MNDVIQKAKDLGKAIALSEEFSQLKKAEQTLYGDKDAMSLLKQHELLISKVQTYRGAGLQLPTSLLQELDVLQGKLEESPAIQEFLKKQRDYEDFLKKINEEISREIQSVQWLSFRGNRQSRKSKFDCV